MARAARARSSGMPLVAGTVSTVRPPGTVRLVPVAGADGAVAPGAAVTATRSGPCGPRTVHVVRPGPGPAVLAAVSWPAGRPDARAIAGSAAEQRAAEVGAVEDVVVEDVVVEDVVVDGVGSGGAGFGGAGFGGTGVGGTGVGGADFVGGGVDGAGFGPEVEVAEVEVAEVGTGTAAAGPCGVEDVAEVGVPDDAGAGAGRAGTGARSELGERVASIVVRVAPGLAIMGDPGTPAVVGTPPAVGIRAEGEGSAASVGVPSTTGPSASTPSASPPPAPASEPGSVPEPEPVESGTGSAPEA